jgi:acyl carrier protein
MSERTDTPQHTDELRDWLVERVAFYLDRPAEGIDPDAELAEYGMDSVYALSVISDIEDRFEAEIDETAVRRYRTVNGLVGYLAGLG